MVMDLGIVGILENMRTEYGICIPNKPYKLENMGMAYGLPYMVLYGKKMGKTVTITGYD